MRWRQRRLLSTRHVPGGVHAVLRLVRPDGLYGQLRLELELVARLLPGPPVRLGLYAHLRGELRPHVRRQLRTNVFDLLTLHVVRLALHDVLCALHDVRFMCSTGDHAASVREPVHELR